MIMGGALCCGCAYMAFAGFGGPARQLVHASPDKVYSAFSESFSNVEQSGIVKSESGPVAYQVEVEKVADRSIDVVWDISGDEAGHLHLGFAPDGKGNTMVTGTVKADAQKIRDTLGYSAASFPTGSSFAMDAGLSTMLADAAKKIEDGEPIGAFGKRIDVSDGDWSRTGRNYAEEARQREATRPIVNPDADARKYLHHDY
jgi:hypothetical protein